MNLRILSLVGVLACSFSLGCGDDDDGDGGGSLAANCQKICSMTVPLDCPMDPDNCAASCETEVNGLTKCKAQMEAAIACGATRPASDYACSADTGEAELSESACTAETNAFFACSIAG